MSRTDFGKGCEIGKNKHSVKTILWPHYNGQKIIDWHIPSRPERLGNHPRFTHLRHKHTMPLLSFEQLLLRRWVFHCPKGDIIRRLRGNCVLIGRCQLMTSVWACEWPIDEHWRAKRLQRSFRIVYFCYLCLLHQSQLNSHTSQSFQRAYQTQSIHGTLPRPSSPCEMLPISKEAINWCWKSLCYHNL